MARLSPLDHAARGNALARLEMAAYALAWARGRGATPRAIAGKMTARRHARAACEKLGIPEREIRRILCAGNDTGFADSRRSAKRAAR